MNDDVKFAAQQLAACLYGGSDGLDLDSDEGLSWIMNQAVNLLELQRKDIIEKSSELKKIWHLAGSDARCEDLRFTLLNMITPELLAYIQLPRDTVKMRNPAGEIALPERLTSTLERPPTVHILHHGYPLCDFATGTPASWPVGHSWVRLGEQGANCETCVNVGRKKQGGT